MQLRVDPTWNWQSPGRVAAPSRLFLSLVGVVTKPGAFPGTVNGISNPARARPCGPASFLAALASPWQPQGQAKFLCLFKRTACYPRAPSRACRGLNHHGNSKSSQLALRTLRGSSVMAPPLPAPRASFTMATEYGLLGLGLGSPQRREGSAKGCGCGEILASRREVPEVLVAGCISSSG